MGTSQADKVANHERIIDTAATMIRRDGLTSLSVSNLMQRAGLTHGGFYRHFASRDALITQAVDGALDASFCLFRLCTRVRCRHREGQGHHIFGLRQWVSPAFAIAKLNFVHPLCFCFFFRFLLSFLLSFSSSFSFTGTGDVATSAYVGFLSSTTEGTVVSVLKRTASLLLILRFRARAILEGLCFLITTILSEKKILNSK